MMMPSVLPYENGTGISRQSRVPKPQTRTRHSSPYLKARGLLARQVEIYFLLVMLSGSGFIGKPVLDE